VKAGHCGAPRKGTAPQEAPQAGTSTRGQAGAATAGAGWRSRAGREKASPGTRKLQKEGGLGKGGIESRSGVLVEGAAPIPLVLQDQTTGEVSGGVDAAGPPSMSHVYRLSGRRINRLPAQIGIARGRPPFLPILGFSSRMQRGGSVRGNYGAIIMHSGPPVSGGGGAWRAGKQTVRSVTSPKR